MLLAYSMFKKICVLALLALASYRTHAGVIFTQEGTQFGPPFVQLSSGLRCFTLINGTEICDKNSITFFLALQSPNTALPLIPSPGNNGELALIEGGFGPVAAGHEFIPYFLGNQLNGRYLISLTKTSAFGPNDSAFFQVTSKTDFSVASGGPGNAHFDAIPGEDYYLAIFGYSRTPQAYRVVIAPSEVSEVPTLATFCLGIGLLIWTHRQRKSTTAIKIF